MAAVKTDEVTILVVFCVPRSKHSDLSFETVSIPEKGNLKTLIRESS